MNGIAVLIALSTLGVDYSWRTSAEGNVEYILQVEPVFVQSLVDGEEIHSDVPAEAGNANRIILRIGTKEAAKSAANVQLASSILRSPSRLTTDSPTLLWRAGKAPEETAAVTYGWQPGTDGNLMYYLQADPTLLRTLASGDEIHAIIRPDAGRVATFVAVAGTKQLPKVAAGQKPATTSLVTTPPTTTPPLTTPPLTTPPASTRPGTGSSFDSARTRFNPSPEVSPAGGTEFNPASEPPLYRTGATTPPATTNPGLADTSAGTTRPRWSIDSNLPAETNPAIDPARTGSSGLLDPPAYSNDPRANPGNQYLAPVPDYRTDTRPTAMDDPSRRFDTGTGSQFDTSRSTTGGGFQDGGYRTGATPDYQSSAGQNAYTNQTPTVPFRERQTGFDNQQQYQQPPPDDRFASRAPNVPVGATRPVIQTDPGQAGYPATQTMMPQTAFGQQTAMIQPAPQVPVAPVPPVETKPIAQPLSIWAFLWCLVFFSVGGNFYLGWTAAEFYSRYKLANERLRAASR